MFSSFASSFALLWRLACWLSRAAVCAKPGSEGFLTELISRPFATLLMREIVRDCVSRGHLTLTSLQILTSKCLAAKQLKNPHFLEHKRKQCKNQTSLLLLKRRPSCDGARARIRSALPGLERPILELLNSAGSQHPIHLPRKLQERCKTQPNGKPIGVFQPLAPNQG